MPMNLPIYIAKPCVMIKSVKLAEKNQTLKSMECQYLVLNKC